MKSDIFHAQETLNGEIIVDNFAGGGGASSGIELALGRIVNAAINHDPAAILMHKTNHPYTEHYQASVWDINPREVCRGRPVALAWFSPDCKHFSKAKGAALVDKHIRGLAWIALRWAGTVRPRVIILENVEEFQTWGPVRKGKPVKKKAGQTFQKFIKQLRDLKYRVEWRELVAADYGAPTTRKRFVLIARCDGRPICWPEPTHAPRGSEAVKSGKLLPWPEIRELLNRYCGYHLADDEILLLEIGMQLYYIADIGLRMLCPRELYNAMGFPPDYIIDRDYMGNPYPKNEQVARCGNAVCPPLAAAVVRVNFPEYAVHPQIETMAQLMEAVAV